MMGFLKDCHKIESLAGTVYRQLSRDGSYSEEVRTLFLQLATDERPMPSRSTCSCGLQILA